MRNWIILLLLAALALSSKPAFAQQNVGDSEFQLQGTLSLALSGKGHDLGSAFANYGRFFTIRHEAGVSVGTFITGNGDLTGWGGPFYRYNFAAEKLVPYVGAAVGAAFGSDGIGDGALLTFEGGARYFLNRSTALSLAGETDYSVDEQEFGDTLRILFGFSYLWAR